MSPEVISFVEARWARATETKYGTHLAYGVGRICASYTLFTDPIEAMFAEADWLHNGMEPKRTGTLQGMPAVSDEQLEAMRFEQAAMALEAGHV